MPPGAACCRGTFYPGTGAPDEVGLGPGSGYTVNVAWDGGGVADGDYAAALRSLLLPIAREFAPQLVVISAGFDAAAGDPIGGCDVSADCFGAMAAAFAEVAPSVLVLEGGYNLAATAAATEACLRALVCSCCCSEAAPVATAAADDQAAAAAVAAASTAPAPEVTTNSNGSVAMATSTSTSAGTAMTGAATVSPAPRAGEAPLLALARRRGASAAAPSAFGWLAIQAARRTHSRYWACLAGAFPAPRCSGSSSLAAAAALARAGCQRWHGHGPASAGGWRPAAAASDVDTPGAGPAGCEWWPHARAGGWPGTAWPTTGGGAAAGLSRAGSGCAVLSRVSAPAATGSSSAWDEVASARLLMRRGPQPSRSLLLLRAVRKRTLRAVWRRRARVAAAAAAATTTNATMATGSLTGAAAVVDTLPLQPPANAASVVV